MITSKENLCASIVRATLLLTVPSLLLMTACKQKAEINENAADIAITQEVQPAAGETTVASPIMYEVIIKAHQGLTEWEKEMVAGYKGSYMIRDIINKVFNGEIPAYEYFTGKQMGKKQLQILKDDPEFGVEQIGRLQFTESWFYDNNLHRMRKQIHKVVFGYEDLDENNQVIGYKAAFFVYMDGSTH